MIIERELIGGPLDGTTHKLDSAAKVTILRTTFTDKERTYASFCMYRVENTRLVFEDMKSEDDLCTLWLVLRQLIKAWYAYLLQSEDGQSGSAYHQRLCWEALVWDLAVQAVL